MTDAGQPAARVAHTPYSPRFRTALVLTGTGTAGAYHAGVLRAIREAGVKIDIVAGRGIGVVGALFAAVDGGARLWSADGFWRSPAPGAAYPWRPAIRALAWTLWVTLALTLIPLVFLAGGLIVYPLSYGMSLAHLRAGAALADAYAGLVAFAFRPGTLPTWLPQAAVLLCGALLVQLVLAARRASGQDSRRRVRGAFWWRVFGAPLDSRAPIDYWRGALWRLMTGGAKVPLPGQGELSRRYAEVLADGLGQPGFRELIAVVHDLDTRRDLVAALLAEGHRHAFFGRGRGGAWAHRAGETLDLAGVGRDHAMDVLAAALSVPVVSEPWPVTFAPDSFWRGETHRVCDRPEGVARLIEEVVEAGAEQVIVVSASPALSSPHTLKDRRIDGHGRLGDWLAAAEAAAVRDAVRASARSLHAVFLIEPAHNPIGPFDCRGAYDERSDRVLPLSELTGRGYEDAYRQFIEPEVGAGGDDLPQAPA